MAKMFYSMEESCAKLAKSEDEIKDMIEGGQIQEFRDRDKLMFKVDQIDLLCATEDETSEIHLGLEDTSGASGSGLDLADESIIGLADSISGHRPEKPRQRRQGRHRHRATRDIHQGIRPFHAAAYRQPVGF